MTVHDARTIALAAVLIGITALSPYARVLAQRPLNELPLDELRVLAEQGDAEAQFTLGGMYQFGQGVAEDDAEAVRWFRRAADQGHAFAQFNLATMSATGEGVPQDDAEAGRWFRLAADQGNPTARFRLGRMYANGRGVPQDDVEAHMWFSLAIAHYSGGDPERFEQARNEVAERMTADQIAEAQRRAREWRPNSGAPTPRIRASPRSA